MIKTQENYCLITTMFGDGIILSKDSWFSKDCARPNKSNIWKNELGQVYNGYGRAIWWNGDKSNTF